MDGHAHTIEVGAADGTLRFWQAAEGVRQAELRLTAQAASRAAIEQRGGAMAGWCNAGLLALGAGLFSNPDDAQLAAIVVAAAFLVAALISCLLALQPREWGTVGYDWSQMQACAADSELEQRELMAVGYAGAIAMNEARLHLTARHVRAATLGMALAPAAGLVILAVGAWARG